MEKTPGSSSQDLKQRREERGLSLEDLFNKTRVRMTYLQAIENKDFASLPVPVYAKNFIKIYAQALGVDSQPLLHEYEEYLDSLKVETPKVESVEREKPSAKRLTPRKTYLAIALVLIVVVAAHWLISGQDETSPDLMNPPGGNVSSAPNAAQQNANADISLNQQTNVPPADALKENSTQAPVEVKSFSSGGAANEAVSPRKLLPQNVNAQNVTDPEAGLVVIRAVEETWLRVKADQNPSFQILLKPGEKFEHKAKSFEIDIGNAGGIKIKFKGKDIENLGKAGEVVHLRLP